MINFVSDDLIKRYLDRKKLDLFLNEVEQANRRFNLFSRNAQRRDLEVLVAESLIPIHKGWIDKASDSLLDIGSGWGIPAIPILLSYQDINITLLERSQKKADFLLLLLHRLNLSAEVVCSDLNIFQALHQYSLITLRRVAVDQKLLKRLEGISSSDSNMVYFGSNIPENIIESAQSLKYSIDNLPGRYIIKYPIC